MTTLDNPYVDLNLHFRQGEPLSWTLTVSGADWSGAYVAQIVDVDTETVLATLDVSATYSDPNTELAIQLSSADSALIPPGRYHWAARVSSGEVRIIGLADIDKEVVPVG